MSDEVPPRREHEGDVKTLTEETLAKQRENGVHRSESGWKYFEGSDDSLLDMEIDGRLM